MSESENQPVPVNEAAPVSPAGAKKESRREFFEAIFFALALALFIRTFVVQAFKIPSGSMIPTLLVGDHILVNKFIYGIPIPFTDKKLVEFKTPKRGEVIVFKFPKDPSKDFIKRVIGVPGDVVEMRDTVLYINGEPLPVSQRGTFAYHESEEPVESRALLFDEVIGDTIHPVLYDAEPQPGYRSFESITVPEGKLFVMGDNRDHSNDSRYWGFVDISAVEGRAIAIYWSWNSDDFSLRWQRLGNFIY